MLTLDQLIKMQPHQVIAFGEVRDNDNGINIMNTDNILRWIAIRGVISDWSIYIDQAYKSYEEIGRSGDKIYNDENIKKLVPCTKDAMMMYRY